VVPVHSGPLQLEWVSITRIGSANDRHYLDYALQTAEVVGVPRVQRQSLRGGRCRDQKVDGAPSACLSASLDDGRVNSPVGACRGSVEREGLEGRLDSLKSILARSPLRGIGGGMRARSELRESNGGHRDLQWQLRFVREVDRD